MYMMFDITFCKRIEWELRLLAVLEAPSDLTSTAEKEQNVLFINSGGHKLLGISPQENVLGRKIGQHHTEWALTVLEKAVATTTKKGLWGGKTAIRHSEGYEIPVSQVIIA